MATREEIVRFVYDIVGDEKLANAIASMLKAGETAEGTSEEFQALSKALNESATRAKEIGDAIDLQDKLSKNAKALKDAQAGLAALNAEFSKTDKTSVEVTTAFQQAATQVRALGSEQLKLQNQFASTNASLRQSGVNTQDLSKALQQAKDDGTRAATSLASLGTGASGAAKSIGEIVEKSSVLSRVVDQVKSLATAFAGLFVIDKAKNAIEGVLSAGDKAAKFKQQFADAFGGIEAGARALADTRDIAERVPLALDDIQESALRAKRVGLDPFDGTLEKLIQTNAKWGGSVDTLNGRIDLLGKAVARGGLDLRTLTALQQEGIPAAELLGKAMGKTAAEIRDLASSGKLGGDAVHTLIDALAKSGAADAGSQLGLLSTQVQKLNDLWQDFLETIANSGAYQFVQEQLSNLTAAFKRGLADGTVEKAARAISDAIVGIGKAIVGTTQFLVDHAASIAILARGYVAFKTALLALDLANAAQKWVGFGTAAKDAAEAVTGAAASAEKAAAETGGFGKLRATIGKIPKAILVGLTVAGVDFAIGQLEKLIEVTQEYYDVKTRGKEIDADAAQQNEKNLARARELSEQLKGFAETQVASADELATKNKRQSDAYVEQLQNATRYYTALRIQAQSIGDAKGVEAATARLKDLGVALVAARQHQDEVTASTKRLDEAVQPIVDRFDKLKTSGVSAAEAIATAFKEIDVKTPAGLQSAIEIIRQVSARSAEAKAAVKDELVGALKALDEVDLRAFQANVTEALASAKGNAEELKTALGAALTASLLNLGVSAEEAGVKVTAAGEKIIATFDDIANNAQASGRQIQSAFAHAIASASTEGEVQELQRRLKSAFDAGRIGADEFGVASEAAGRKLASIRIAAGQAEAGLDGVGKAGQNAAQRLSGALQDARDDLIVQENQLSAELAAALAADDQTLAAALNAQIKLVAQQVDGLNAKIDELTSKPIPIPPPNTSGFRRGTDEINQQIAGVNEGLRNIIHTSNDAFEKIGDGVQVAITSNTTDVVDAMAAWESAFAATSRAASDLFNKLVRDLFGRQANFDADTTGFTRLGEAINEASATVSKRIAEQKQGVADLAAQYENMSDASLRAFVNQRGGADRVAASLAGDAAAAREGRSAFDLLGAADLSGLQSALDSTAQRVRQISADAKQAKQDIEDIGSALQDEIDRANGNEVDIENRRFEKQIQDIKDKAKLAGTLNDAETARVLRLAEQLHRINLKHIEDEAAAKKKADNDVAANKKKNDDAAAAGTTTPGEGGQATGQHAAPGINVHVDGSVIGGTPDQIADSFARLLLPKFNNIWKRSL
jgi:tape measure domain-containing protein